MKRETVGNILFAIGFMMTMIGGGALLIWIITIITFPWIFLYVSLLGVGIFLNRWGEHLLSNSAKIQSFPKNTPAKPSKPRNPWIEGPKVEKKDDKETKDDIPKIWEEKALA